jgi:predicted dithiol-disulfide oxidoreductase (DUF899 family)
MFGPRTKETKMSSHKVVSRAEWQTACEKLLEREKQHTRLGDELAGLRRELPWVRMEAEYSFATDDGTKTLLELFDGRSQLLIYHFMFGPSYSAGCPTCSSIADSLTHTLPHLHARDVTMVCVSHAPIEKIQAYRQRMGWGFPWASCSDTDFNFELGFSRSEEQTRALIAPMRDAGKPPILQQMERVTDTDAVSFLSEVPGFSAFALDNRAIYHTYSTTARGLEFLMGYYQILDRAPKGRDEADGAQLWIRRHDEYGQATGPVTAA